MAYHSGSGRVVLFGGQNNGGSLSDTWTWDGGRWTQETPGTSPSPRFAMGLAPDPTGSLVMFGGGGTSGVTNETWTWNGTTWHQETPVHAPTRRTWMSMAFDAVRNNTVLFGGCGCDFGLNDTWTWDGGDWTLRTPSTRPAPRYRASAAFDSVHGAVVLFGGATCPDGGCEPVERNNARTWIWNGADWTTAYIGPPPPAQYSHAMAFDGARGRLVMYGGIPDSTPRYTWLWDNTRWVQGGIPRPKYVAFGDSITTGFSIEGCVENTQAATPWNCGPDPNPPATPYPDLVSQVRGWPRISDDPAFYASFFPRPGFPDLDLDRVGIWGYTAQKAAAAYDTGHNDVGPWKPQLKAAELATDLITGALGINDMRFSDIAMWASKRISDLHDCTVPPLFRCGHQTENRAAELACDLGCRPNNTLARIYGILGAIRASGVELITHNYYNPYADQPTCTLMHSTADISLRPLNDLLRSYAHDALAEWADFYAAFRGHGSGDTDRYPFGRTCDGGDTILSSRLPQTISANPGRTLEQLRHLAFVEFDPHPGPAGTAAMRDAIGAAVPA